MTSKSFFADRAIVHHADSRDVLKTIADNSIDSVVTDPPYALVSIVKRFGKDGAAPAQEKHGGGAYARASAGFMGQQWDTGETAFAVEFWAEVFRVLKPGGHVVAFSGTRTYHRLALAIEDAGFEIRDQLGWLYGTGFPKSHDVSKGIDKRKDWAALKRLGDAIKAARKGLGISQTEAARRVGLIGPDESLGGGGFMWFETGRLPTRDEWPKLKAALVLGDDFDAAFEEAEREVVGSVEMRDTREVKIAVTDSALDYDSAARRMVDITAPATDLARKWQGWGTALKPAWEPIVLARKPLIGTVVENVLQHGTGAINVDGCRVANPDYDPTKVQRQQSNRQTWEGGDASGFKADHEQATYNSAGRFPANVVHDGSPEVEEAFGLYAEGVSRFFYCAKASKADRAGSKHPTVKPGDLMRWLVRLVTPKGGVVLEPFAGSGTTVQACLDEGSRCIAIEREEAFFADICKRLEAYAPRQPAKPKALRKPKVSAPANVDEPLQPVFFDLEVA